jgi:hypothetical protein
VPEGAAAAPALPAGMSASPVATHSAAIPLPAASLSRRSLPPLRVLACLTIRTTIDFLPRGDGSVHRGCREHHRDATAEFPKYFEFCKKTLGMSVNRKV